MKLENYGISPVGQKEAGSPGTSGVACGLRYQDDASSLGLSLSDSDLAQRHLSLRFPVGTNKIFMGKYSVYYKALY